ncbi:hypothetical protein Cgig2_020330 [Carnegiea gigantea]|uniref:BHLH domain-containing protein n=1 Tax=Carnegiea gigantea TaxID=171969 RepID=A0A9Q1KDQ2_9CARY|nr:hypothetical protein Cgig2_020330 [Carnegiea gigantea]
MLCFWDRYEKLGRLGLYIRSTQIMSSATLNSWFAELEDMEDPLALQEFIGDCLVDYTPEDIMDDLEELDYCPSSGSDCNSSTAVAEMPSNNSTSSSNSSGKRQKLDDYPRSHSAVCKENNDGNNDSNENITEKSWTQTESTQGPGQGPVLGLESSNKHRGGTTPAKKPRRLPEQCHNHIIAERQRRQTLSERFIALSALIPGLKKILEEENATRAVESVVVVKRSQVVVENENNSSNSNSNLDSGSDSINNGTAYHNKQLPEIEARFANKCVLVKIHCQMQKGVFVKLMTEIERLHLSMEMEFDMTPQDVVKVLRLVFG